jgi:hypothetical protein
MTIKTSPIPKITPANPERSQKMRPTTKPYKCPPWKWILPVLVFLCSGSSLAVNVGIEYPDLTSDSTIVLLNADDDDHDGTPDKEQTIGPIQHEDDLKEVNISINPGSAYTGHVTISVESVPTKIKVWGDAKKSGQPVTHQPLTYPWTVDVIKGELQPNPMQGKLTKFLSRASKAALVQKMLSSRRLSTTATLTRSSLPSCLWR